MSEVMEMCSNLGHATHESWRVFISVLQLVYNLRKYMTSLIILFKTPMYFETIKQGGGGCLNGEKRKGRAPRCPPTMCLYFNVIQYSGIIIF